MNPTERRWCLMPEADSRLTANLNEIETRNQAARSVISETSVAVRTLAENWQLLEDALSDVPALSDEVTRLAAELADARLGRANILAAGRAALAAWDEGEPEPLSYLRDELAAQSVGSQRRPT
jgi:hypothetical protein